MRSHNLLEPRDEMSAESPERLMDGGLLGGFMEVMSDGSPRKVGSHRKGVEW